MIKAAGTLIATPTTNNGKLILFLRRGDGSDHPNEWCFPGGQLEEGESLMACAIRETAEECGWTPDPELMRYHTRAIAPAETPVTAVVETVDPINASAVAGVGEVVPVVVGEDVDFTTYMTAAAEPFVARLSDEHTAWAWATPEAPPLPLHPGCAIALERLSLDELGVARAMAAGRLTSPQVYGSFTMWTMRVTGTGLSYRAALKEYVWRDPSIYMNEEFCQRCAGLAVIFEHPKGSNLDSKEYDARNVGSIALAFLRPDVAEVWSVVKIYDDDTNRLMEREQLSTSPAVVFGPESDNERLTLDNGRVILVEGKPRLLDHLAICEKGVWDKNGPARGIERVVEEPTLIIIADSDDGAWLDTRNAMLLNSIRLSNLASRFARA